MITMKLVEFLLLPIIIGSCIHEQEFCDISEKNAACASDRPAVLNERYIFYDVNAPEGFNLRRDVYMRMAIFAKNLRRELGNWYLVLPPWPHLYHWQSKDISDQHSLPWSTFFDVQSLASFAPVIEMSEFFQTGQKTIDNVHILQHFEDTFTTGNFNDRMEVEPCQNQHYYKRTKQYENYSGYFWGFKNVTAKDVNCLSFHGHASQLINFIKDSEARSIMFDHAEVALHDRFGDKTYWDARKSMVFASHLREEAKRYLEEKLNVINVDSTGGSYLCVHLRRKDFIRGRTKDVPSIKGATQQIENALKELGLNTVFIATDAIREEKTELKSHLQHRKVHFYNPSAKVKENLKDGGIAIVEQIICSHARKFIGTHESTFSFRIQEEREILGFPSETTFSRLCGDSDTKCRQPAQWRIVH